MKNYRWLVIGILLLVMFVGVVSADVLTTSQFGAGTSVDGNPIGGGTGYSDIKTSGDCTATDAATLISCLSTATSGQVVYVPETANINMTGIYNTAVNAGITVAGNRGSSGSAGGRIFQNTIISDGMYGESILLASGNNVRITGLRIDGGDYSYHSYTVERIAIRNNNYAGLIVDNNEIFGWTGIGVLIDISNTTLVAEGLLTPELGSAIANIHHNYIHNNQMGGEGYGVDINHGSALIKGNLFAYNRHSIANGAGQPNSGYEASYNHNIAQISDNGQIFDVHGFPSDGGIAGEITRIHHNSVRNTLSASIELRGTPLQTANISYNILQNGTQQAVRQSYGATGNITMFRNIIDNGYFAGDMVYHAG